jgi:hypothetical protein
VIRLALEADGKFTSAARRWLADQPDATDADAERFFDVLVRLVCGMRGEALLEGQGNFGALCYGHPDNPPAHPRYTECRITPRGLQHLADTAPDSSAAPVEEPSPA